MNFLFLTDLKNQKKKEKCGKIPDPEAWWVKQEKLVKSDKDYEKLKEAFTQHNNEVRENCKRYNNYCYLEEFIEVLLKKTKRVKAACFKKSDLGTYYYYFLLYIYFF